MKKLSFGNQAKAIATTIGRKDSILGHWSSTGKKHPLANTANHPKDPTNASIDARIEALTTSIDQDLRNLRNVLNAGNNDSALTKCMLIANKRNTLFNLVAIRNAKLDEPAKVSHTDETSLAKPIERRTVIKPKRFKTWADK